MVKKLWSILLSITLFSVAAQAQSTEDYIAERVDHAQELMRDNGIPASVIIAVAIHESASGQSKIARYMNNHFGIKGPNNNTEIRSAYKDYESVEASYDHFIEFLKSRATFNPLFDKYDQYDYRAWARGIHRGGYAASRSWTSQIVGLIKKYELYQYDERPEDYVEPAVVVSNTPKKRASTASGRRYTVKSGDNLSTIAKRYHTSTKAIMKKNGLKSIRLKPGQKIRI
ncbi:glucosaminidase domain-containing protein [Pedobacter sp. PLR]|uniref:glucosaminidase domain-containing protein n=1 Tax=Pedobacter sp. PLR TaxID=2994465 RepID=UPI002245B531|nr:glucosaminidase domain-containing protein [Pedobacter sp. PLR]MCX2453005.1 glucosaminidase domain-containing protein [Pedobacter sp. PLR]